MSRSLRQPWTKPIRVQTRNQGGTRPTNCQCYDRAAAFSPRATASAVPDTRERYGRSTRLVMGRASAHQRVADIVCTSYALQRITGPDDEQHYDSAVARAVLLCRRCDSEPTEPLAGSVITS